MATNLMVTNPGLFDGWSGIMAQQQYCRQARFLPVRSKVDFVEPDYTAGKDYQQYILADLKPTYREKWRHDHHTPRRTLENLVPTGILFESDSLTIQEQQQNLKPEALKHVYSVVYSAKKSLHIVVPVPYELGQRITANSTYKRVARKLAYKFFKDPLALDTKVWTIGRLARMPGSMRYEYSMQEDGRERLDETKPVGRQVCVYYNPSCAPVPDLADIIREAEVEEAGLSCRVVMQPYLREDGVDHTYDEDMARLKRSVEMGSKYKQVILDSLTKGVTPSDREMPFGKSLLGSVLYVKKNYPGLAEPYITLAVKQHPSNLTKGLNYYLGREPVEQAEQAEQAAQPEGREAV